MSRLGLAIGALALFSGCEKAASIPGEELPQMSLSTNRVNFGPVEWGDTVYETITVTNTGKLTCVSSISLGVEEMEENFALHLGARSLFRLPSRLGRHRSHRHSNKLAGADASLIGTLTLEQNCSYDFLVSMTPQSAGGDLGSVLIETKTALGAEPLITRIPTQPKPHHSPRCDQQRQGRLWSVLEPSILLTPKRVMSSLATLNLTMSETVH